MLSLIFICSWTWSFSRFHGYQTTQHRGFQMILKWNRHEVLRKQLSSLVCLSLSFRWPVGRGGGCWPSLSHTHVLGLELKDCAVSSNENSRDWKPGFHGKMLLCCHFQHRLLFCDLFRNLVHLWNSLLIVLPLCYISCLFCILAIYFLFGFNILFHSL